ncbi:phage tail protein I [Denitromonas sp.]|uniref:phage tail protein I n=1 Tax=Denitromonas sp. TaxID=2734609 RepID=UPI003A83BA57
MTEPADVLLPPSATDLERRTAAACADATDLPVPLRTLWNPYTCPVALLPYLAWAFSVDRWDASWAEATKRAVIAGSWWVHKRKGTIGAIRRVVEPLGYLIEVVEWFEEVPEATPGTFRLRIGVLDTGITDEMYLELERLIDDAKPLTRHMTGLAISLESRGTVRMAAAAYLGDELTVYPFEPGDIEIHGAAPLGGADHTIDTMSVYPS